MLRVAVRQRLGDFLLDLAFEGPGDGVTVLFGPSGAGKSATLAAIGGIGRPESAAIALDGRVLTDTAQGIALPPQRRRIGWVHQDARLFPHLPVRANLLYGARRAAAGAQRITLADVVAVLDIAALLDRGVRDLSGGERQRVALGRALLSQPDLLLLDEPLAALDRRRRHEILGFIVRLKREFALPMVYVTHGIDEASALADRVVRIEAGRAIAAGDATMLAPLAATADYRARVIGIDAAAGTARIAAAGLELLIPAADHHPGDMLIVTVRRDTADAP